MRMKMPSWSPIQRSLGVVALENAKFRRKGAAPKDEGEDDEPIVVALRLTGFRDLWRT